MSSITYRIATGAQARRQVITLQTLPGDAGPQRSDAGKVGGFSLHAGVAAEAHESEKLEHLCRYIARPAISEKRLSLSPQGTALPAQDAAEEWRHARGATSGVLPFALRASLRLFPIAPGDWVGIDVSTCVHCGGAVRIVASIEDPAVIRATLDHFEKHGAMEEAH